MYRGKEKSEFAKNVEYCKQDLKETGREMWLIGTLTFHKFVSKQNRVNLFIIMFVCFLQCCAMYFGILFNYTSKRTGNFLGSSGLEQGEIFITSIISIFLLLVYEFYVVLANFNNYHVVHKDEDDLKDDHWWIRFSAVFLAMLGLVICTSPFFVWKNAAQWTFFTYADARESYYIVSFGPAFYFVTLFDLIIGGQLLRKAWESYRQTFFKLPTENEV